MGWVFTPPLRGRGRFLVVPNRISDRVGWGPKKRVLWAAVVLPTCDDGLRRVKTAKGTPTRKSRKPREKVGIPPLLGPGVGVRNRDPTPPYGEV